MLIHGLHNFLITIILPRLHASCTEVIFYKPAASRWKAPLVPAIYLRSILIWYYLFVIKSIRRTRSITWSKTLRAQMDHHQYCNLGRTKAKAASFFVYAHAFMCSIQKCKRGLLITKVTVPMMIRPSECHYSSSLSTTGDTLHVCYSHLYIHATGGTYRPAWVTHYKVLLVCI